MGTQIPRVGPRFQEWLPSAVDGHPRADPEQCCWGGGARTVEGVRARRREAPSSKCDRGSTKRLPRELRQGSGGAKIGLLES